LFYRTLPATQLHVTPDANASTAFGVQVIALVAVPSTTPRTHVGLDATTPDYLAIDTLGTRGIRIANATPIESAFENGLRGGLFVPRCLHFDVHKITHETTLHTILAPNTPTLVDIVGIHEVAHGTNPPTAPSRLDLDNLALVVLAQRTDQINRLRNDT
jgi:hypothetical protein